MSPLHRRFKEFAYFALAAFLFFGLVQSGLADEWAKVMDAAKREG